MVDTAEDVLFGGVGRRTSVRCQSVSVSVPTVHLGTSAARRSGFHHLSDPISNQVLLFVSDECQHTR